VAQDSSPPSVPASAPPASRDSRRTAPDIEPSIPRSIRLHHDRFPSHHAAFDTAVSHAMLRRVAAGALPESLRLYRPENVLLFSSLDARRRGYERAVEIAEAAGFATAIRLAGGHAAAFLEESLAFAWAIPDDDARNHIRPRFEALANLIATALCRLGLDARVGEIPGEYCPGEFSVNIGGRVKVMGVGQRVIRGGAHIGGVLTIAQSDQLRAALIPVYEALELDFRPETAGGVQEFDTSLGVDDIMNSLTSVLNERGIWLQATTFDAATLEAAEGLVAMHDAHAQDRRGSSLVREPYGKTLFQTDRSGARDATRQDDES
jgi:octanoyl-[GcvH]:protein N-octanoyltransferase